MALGAGIFMFIGGFFSLVFFLDYLEHGEIEMAVVGTPCIIIGVVSLVVFVAYNLPIARVLIITAPAQGRRAAYFQLLFPILLVSFLIATPQAGFAPSLTFVFPLLLLGAFAYPYTALQMKRWIKVAEIENLVVLMCFRCSYQLEMHKDERLHQCPYCGQVNLNPRQAGEGEAKGEAMGDTDGGPLSP